MKKAILTAFLIYAVVFGALTAAQLNYLHAIKDAQQSEGTDQAIEMVMQAHGFNVDANDPQEPSTSEKFRALIKTNF